MFERVRVDFETDGVEADDRIDDLIADLEETRGRCEAFAERLEAEDGA